MPIVYRYNTFTTLFSTLTFKSNVEKIPHVKNMTLVCIFYFPILYSTLQEKIVFFDIFGFLKLILSFTASSFGSTVNLRFSAEL